MKGILLLNGEPYSQPINSQNAYVVCCDGAYRWAKHVVKIDQNVGDFDSLDEAPVPPPSKIYPSEKDETDGEIALYELLRHGVDEVEVYGGFGGRQDHFLGNLHLLYQAAKRGVVAKMIAKDTTVVCVCGSYTLRGLAQKTVSVLPFGGDAHIINGKGFKYSYPPVLEYGTCRGISNIVAEDTAIIECEKSDCILIVINRSEV